MKYFVEWVEEVSVGKELADKLEFIRTECCPLLCDKTLAYTVILLEECDLKHFQVIFFLILCDIAASGRKLNPLREFVREALNTCNYM